MRKLSYLLVLMVALLFAAALLFIGYYALILDKAALQQTYQKTFTGRQLTVVTGQAEIKGSRLQVNELSDQHFALFTLSGLNINPEINPELIFRFTEAPLNLKNVLVLYHSQSNQPLEVRREPFNRQYERINLQTLLPKGAVLLELGLVFESPFFKSVTIESIDFPSKAIDIETFAQMIISGFRVAHNWEGYSINFRPYVEARLFLPSQYVILAWMGLAYLLFNLLTWKAPTSAKRNIWLFALLAWLALDSRFFYEQIQIAGTSYQSFAGKDSATDNTFVAPEVYPLAEQILTVLPRDKQARLYYAQTPEQLKAQGDEQSVYFFARLNYYLIPHQFLVTRRRLPKNWQAGDFYLLYSPHYRRADYSMDNKQLQFGQQTLTARQLIKTEALEMYYILPPVASVDKPLAETSNNGTSETIGTATEKVAETTSTKVITDGEATPQSPAETRK